jgi:hypothetical protein
MQKKSTRMGAVCATELTPPTPTAPKERFHMHIENMSEITVEVSVTQAIQQRLALEAIANALNKVKPVSAPVPLKASDSETTSAPAPAPPSLPIPDMDSRVLLPPGKAQPFCMPAGLQKHTNCLMYVTVKTVPPNGGEPVTLCKNYNPPYGANVIIITRDLHVQVQNLTPVRVQVQNPTPVNRASPAVAPAPNTAEN